MWKLCVQEFGRGKTPQLPAALGRGGQKAQLAETNYRKNSLLDLWLLKTEEALVWFLSRKKKKKRQIRNSVLLGTLYNPEKQFFLHPC